MSRKDAQLQALVAPIANDLAAMREVISDAQIEAACKKANCWEFIRNFPRRLETYCGERGVKLSGGQKQRVLIAMALANGPEVLLADEPTTALDSTLRSDLLNLLKDLQTQRGLAMILVSHDMEVVERHADRVAVMFKGEVVECGPVQDVISSPVHPYTQGLLACRVPPVGRPKPLPVLSDFLSPRHSQEKRPVAQIRMAPGSETLNLLCIEGATKTYPGQAQPALQSVSLKLPMGGSLGIVGGSGCGKTTLARAILGLHKLDLNHIGDHQSVFSSNQFGCNIVSNRRDEYYQCRPYYSCH